MIILVSIIVRSHSFHRKVRFTEKLARIMNNSAQNYISGEMIFGEMSEMTRTLIVLTQLSVAVNLPFLKFTKNDL
jgi:hypothetical protein